MARYTVVLNNKAYNLTDREINVLPNIADVLEDNWFGDADTSFNEGSEPVGYDQYSADGIDLCDTRDIPSENDPLRRSIGGILASLNQKGVIVIELRHQIMDVMAGDIDDDVDASDIRLRKVKFIDCWGYHQGIRDLYDAAVAVREKTIREREERRAAREARKAAREAAANKKSTKM